VNIPSAAQEKFETRERAQIKVIKIAFRIQIAKGQKSNDTGHLS
jgi:hypothetical protein